MNYKSPLIRKENLEEEKKFEPQIGRISPSEVMEKEKNALKAAFNKLFNKIT